MDALPIQRAQVEEAEAEERARQQVAEFRRRRRMVVRRRIERAFANATHETVRGLIVIAGAGLVGYGAWLAWPPLGFVTAGALLLAGIWLHDRNE